MTRDDGLATEYRESERDPSTETVLALLAQYRECSAQHLLSYSLTWQVPAVTVAVSGLLVAVTFGYDVPDVARAILCAVGAAFVLAMAIAVERNRMLQLGRRRDLTEIERRLEPLGIHAVEWDVAELADEVRRGEFPDSRLYLVRFEFFRFLRGLLYAVVALLVALSAVSLADALGADILS